MERVELKSSPAHSNEPEKEEEGEHEHTFTQTNAGENLITLTLPATRVFAISGIIAQFFLTLQFIQLSTSHNHRLGHHPLLTVSPLKVVGTNTMIW